MKLAKNFTVGMLLRYVPCIKISVPESICNPSYGFFHVIIVLIKENTRSTCQENEKQQTPSPFMNKIMLDSTL